MVVPSVTPTCSSGRTIPSRSTLRRTRLWSLSSLMLKMLWRWVVTGGRNKGHVGVIREAFFFLSTHKGSFETIHIQDSTGHEFTTRLGNVFTIGKWTSPWVSRPKGKGIKLSLIKEASVESEFGRLGLDEQNLIVDYFKDVLLIRKEWSYNVREQERKISWHMLECAGKLQVDEKK